MAINKKLIHFKNFSDFNSKKLSANENNTQYTLGIDGAVTNGSPDILYQSICWIKDTKQQWTHGQLYNTANYDQPHNQIWYTATAELSLLNANFGATVLSHTYAWNKGTIICNRDIEQIGGSFGVTSYLTSISIPDSVTYIMDDIFAGCRNLATITLSKNLRTIGEEVFYDCDALTEITLPENLRNIGKNAFAYCSNLVKVYCRSITPPSLASNNVFAYGNAERKFYVPLKSVDAYKTAEYWSEYADSIVGIVFENEHLIPSTNLKTINGESILGSGNIEIGGSFTSENEVYIADFTMDSLEMGMHNQEQVACDIPSLVAAMEANKIILVREHELSDYKGTFVLNGFVEDLLYFSIVKTNGTILCCETSYDNGTYIDGRNLYIKTWQDPIADLAAIRDGASKGATAVQSSDLAKVATSGSYNDLSDKPSIGTYTKPTTGIPKSDLNSSVRTSLNKADSSAQTYIVNFDIWQLLQGEEILDDRGDVLRRAVENHKLILIPFDKNTPEFGYLPMSVYAEDGIYFSVVYNTKIISGVVWDNDQELRVEDVIIEDVSKKQDKIKFETGGLSFITASGLNAENADVNVVLPSDANGEEDDILLTRNSVKTINGESIFGSGDITVSGGSGSSSGVTSVKIDNISKTPSNGVVDLGYVNKKLTTSTSSSMSLSPNIYYRNTSTSLSTLTITLGSVSNSDIINEYFVEFTTSSSGTTVSLPSTIKWMNGTAPTFEPSTTYQISIVNNLGTYIKFK